MAEPGCPDRRADQPVCRVVRRRAGRYQGAPPDAARGVGRLKTDMMEDWRGGAELALMQRIKEAVDPKRLMNPGKVLP